MFRASTSQDFPAIMASACSSHLFYVGVNFVVRYHLFLSSTPRFESPSRASSALPPAPQSPGYARADYCQHMDRNRNPGAGNRAGPALEAGTWSTRLQPPGEMFFRGSDELGRDIFSRVLWGARITIPAGLAVIVIGSTLGVVIGAVAGYAGHLIDEGLMRPDRAIHGFPLHHSGDGCHRRAGSRYTKRSNRAGRRLVAPLR